MFSQVFCAVALLAALIVTRGAVHSRACSFVCPASDNGGGLFFDQFFTASELVCEYGRGCSSCEYNKNTGTLDVDSDSGFCPSTAICTSSAIAPRVQKPNGEHRKHQRPTARHAALSPRASSSCSYICPATDSSGNKLFDQFFFTGGLECDYGSRGCGVCDYSSATGLLTSDGDGGFCPSAAISQCTAGRRRASGGVPRAPPTNYTRNEITKAMRDRSILRRL